MARPLALLGLALAGLQLLLWERLSFNDFRFGSICLLAGGALVWGRRGRLVLQSNPGSIAAGGLLIAYTLFRSANQPGPLFVVVAPVFWASGLALVASGFERLRQYWREALLLTLTVATSSIEPVGLELAGLDLAPTTASTTAAILHAFHWPTVARDSMLAVPSGWVVVSQGCSGLKTMCFLAGFAVVVLLVFPVPGWKRQLAILFGAPVIGPCTEW